MFWTICFTYIRMRLCIYSTRNFNFLSYLGNVSNLYLEFIGSDEFFWNFKILNSGCLFLNVNHFHCSLIILETKKIWIINKTVRYFNESTKNYSLEFFKVYSCIFFSKTILWKWSIYLNKLNILHLNQKFKINKRFIIRYLIRRKTKTNTLKSHNKINTVQTFRTLYKPFISTNANTEAVVYKYSVGNIGTAGPHA